MAELLQKFPCGCGIRRYADNSTGIDYCPKHKSAPNMYEALKAILKYGLTNFTRRNAEQAALQAEGRD